jgi:ankyrin repeat protein
MRRSGKHSRIWEVGGSLALVVVVATTAALTVRKQLLNRALASALENSDDRRMAELVRQGADVNTRSPKTRWTPLMRAALQTDDALLREYLDRGANVNAVSRGGATSLMYLCWAGDVQPVEIMLSKGADPSIKDVLGQGPLSCAVQHRHQDLARLLVQRGCDPCERDLGGDNTINIARRNADWEMVRLLKGLDRSLHSR